MTLFLIIAALVLVAALAIIEVPLMLWALAALLYVVVAQLLVLGGVAFSGLALLAYAVNRSVGIYVRKELR